MKKKLLMAAIGAALVAGPMVATQAAPTLYGKLHMSFDRDDNGGSGSAKIERGFFSSNSSRFGIKGDEDLGDGLKAIYQLETRIRADSGGTSTSTTNDSAFSTSAIRSSFAGFTGGAGTFRTGVLDSPMKEIGRSVDLFNERIGDARNVYTAYDNSATSGTAGATINTEGNFVKNAVRYDSPAMGGIKLSALYSAAEGTTPASSTGGRIMGTSAVWTGGPMMAALGYGKADGSGVTTKNESEWRGAFKFDFGPGDVRLFYSKQKDLGGAAVTSKMERNVWGLGASFKVMGSDVVKAQYYKADKLDGVADTGGNELAVGYDHVFSKTTLVYLAYAKTSNDSKTAVFKPAGAGHGDSLAVPADGKGGKSVSAGMELLF